MRTLVRVVVALALGTGLWTACDVHSPTAPGTLASITVTPNATLLINGAQQFIAVGRDAAGVLVPIEPVWSVVALGGGIDPAGMFTAGTVPGVFTATVRAASGAVSGTASVTVTVGALARITVSPNPVTLPMTGTQQYTAVGMDAGDNVIAMTPVWSVVAGGGAITGAGVFEAGIVPGTFVNTISASSGGVAGFATVIVAADPGDGVLATITVSPDPAALRVDEIQEFKAVGHDVNGNVMTISPVWSVVAGGGDMNDGTGLFIAGTTPGSFANTIRAMSGSISGHATVKVSAGDLASIVVSPNPGTMPINDTRQFTAEGRDAAGNVVAIAPTWSVAANGGAINGTGLFTAGTTSGSFHNTVRALSGGISGYATVDITTGPLAMVTVSPTPSALVINGTQQFTAIGTDAGGNIVAMSPVWSVVSGGGAITGAGLFTAGTTPGSFPNTVRALSGGISGLATVTVAPGPLAAITLSPDPGTMPAGATTQFTAVGTDAGGNVVAISPSWAVVNGGGAINGTGLFTAGAVDGTFTNTVRAGSGGVLGFANAVITAVPPLVDLGAAETHGVLGNTTVTCDDLGSIGGDVGVAPGTSITGFPPCGLTGALHAGDAYAQSAHNSLATAYGQVAGMICAVSVTTDLGGQTLQPGVYCSSATQAITGEVFLDALGDPNATFVIQSTTTLLTAAGSRVTLLNGAQSKNVYWAVGSSATLGAGSFIRGNILAFTSITVGSNVTMVGRALAVGGAVTLGTSDVITLP